MRQHDNCDSDQRARFDSLIADSNFDDTVSEQHQRQLRDRALRAFDRVQGPGNVSQPLTPKSAVGDKNLVRNICAIVVIALCLVVMVVQPFTGSGEPKVVDTELTTELTTEEAAIDSTLISSIAAASAFCDSEPVEAIYDALATCQQADEARRIELKAARLLLYETTAPVPSLELPKG